MSGVVVVGYIPTPEGIAGIVVAGALWTVAFIAIKRTTRVDV